MAIPLLEFCDIAGKDITGDALLTQRAIAPYVVEQKADYHFYRFAVREARRR